MFRRKRGEGLAGDGRVVVTGAAGKTGRAVIRALADRGAAVRAWIRRPDQAGAVRRAGADEVVAGDFLDPRCAVRAVEGAAAVYHIAPNVHPDEVEICRRVLDAARAAAVPRFLFHSVLRPQIEAMPHHWRKMRAEELLWTSDREVTVLQPGALMQNLAVHVAGLGAGAPLSIPYAASARFSLVDLGDVAAAAATVALEEGHVGATYELCGPEVHDHRQIADALGAASGLTVRIEETTPAGWRADAEARGQLDAARLDALEAMFRYYDRHGFAGSPTVLSHLLGRPPRTLFEVASGWLA
ncbi:MAG: NAD(P)H-binding protein [Acidobacteriota bacterium]